MTKTTSITHNSNDGTIEVVAFLGFVSVDGRPSVVYTKFGSSKLEIDDIDNFERIIIQ